MALTVVLKPSGFQPVGGGKLVYQMTEATIAGKPNYRVQFQFNGFASLPIFEYRLDSTLTLNADIAPVLRGLLKLSETTTLRFLNTYVKYQAVWDGGSDAQVPLSGDVIYFYIGNNNILNKRTKVYIDATGGSFLVPTAKLYAWNRRLTEVDFLVDGSLTAITTLLAFSENITISQVPIVLCNVDGSVKAMYRGLYYHQNNTGIFLTKYTGGFDVASSTTNSPKIYPGSADYDQGFAQKITPSLGSTLIYVRLAMNKVGLPTYSITFRIIGATAGLPNEADIKATVTYNCTQAFNPTTPSTPTIVFLNLAAPVLNATEYFIQIIPNSDGVGDINNYFNFYTSSVSVYASGSIYNKSGGVWTADLNKDLYCSIASSQFYTSSITIVTISECANPIYLKWLNDLGGISTWLFDYNQDYSIIPKLYGRYKSLKVFANNLAFDAWLMLNELNKDGIDYGDNLKSGQYVVDMTDELNPLSVFIEDKQVQTQTKQTKHRQDLTVRYPLIPNTMS